MPKNHEEGCDKHEGKPILSQTGPSTSPRITQHVSLNLTQPRTDQTSLSHSPGVPHGA